MLKILFIVVDGAANKNPQVDCLRVLYVRQQTDGPIHFIQDRRHHHCLLFRLFTLLMSVSIQNDAK